MVTNEKYAGANLLKFLLIISKILSSFISLDILGIDFMIASKLMILINPFWSLIKISI